MATMVARGFNDIEYNDIKQILKKELDFKVSVRRWKRNYALGAIDIRPTKAQNYKFTDEQLNKIFAVLSRHGKYAVHGEPLEYYFDKHYLFRDGIHFLMQIVK